MEYLTDDIIDAKSLNMSNWLKYFLSKDRSKIFPNNCFPTDKHLDEYIESIDVKSDKEIKAILRRLLIHSCNFGSDKRYFEWNVKHLDRKELFKFANLSEYNRRLLSKGNTWEGITWILDLLPSFPNKASNALNAYFLAHCQMLPDFALHGLSDAGILIAAKYIDYDHPQEIFLNLTPDEFELLTAKLYQSKGYKTELTKKSHDGGVDIIAEKGTENRTEKLIIQCKRYTKKITVREVRELSGTFNDFPLKKGEKATRAVLVCSSDFTWSAKKEFKNNHSIELINFKQLGRQLNKFEGRYWPSKLNRIF